MIDSYDFKEVMTMKHRVISMLLVLMLTVGMMIPSVHAEGEWNYEQIEGGLRLTGYSGSKTELTLPDTLDGQPVISVGAGCFRGSELTEVTIPHGIREIGEEAFADSTDLKKVYLGGSVNVIGARAFANTGLIKMDIPGCVRSIGAEAFLNCDKLYNIVIEEGVEEWSLDVGVGFGSGSVRMEEGVESIGDRAFYGCKNLTKMFVPSSVTQIGSQAIGFTEGGKQNYQITGYAGTAAETYANDNDLTFKVLETKNEDAGVCGGEVQWAFDRSSGTLTISGKGRMYDYAGAECLPWYGFRQSITAAVVEEGVTSLGDFAFSGSAVAQVTLPESLKWVGSQAFANCAELDELSFPGNAPVFAADVFLNTTLTAWYPNFNDTWTPEVRKDYGGTVTWNYQHEHSYEAVVTAPTCTEDGYTTYTCICGESYIADVVPAPGHSYVKTVIAPTCTEGGYTTYTCACGDSYITDEIPPLGHSYVETVIAPTCTENGYTALICACGEQYVVEDSGVDALGHDYVNGKCTRCGDTRESAFDDVRAGEFYFDPVAWAVEKGITTGTSATTFNPGGQCMRAVVVTFLWRANGSPEPTSSGNPFTDVAESDFYYNAVLWAVEQGITNGISATKFGPEALCNRAQVVTFLWRSQGRPESTAEISFTDVKEGEYYTDAVAWAVEKGITNGMGNGTFGVEVVCNRAQVVTFLYRTMADQN